MFTLSNSRYCLRFKLSLAWERGENTATVFATADTQSLLYQREVEINLTDFTQAACVGAALRPSILRMLLHPGQMGIHIGGIRQFQGGQGKIIYTAECT